MNEIQVIVIYVKVEGTCYYESLDQTGACLEQIRRSSWLHDSNYFVLEVIKFIKLIMRPNSCMNLFDRYSIKLNI